MPTVQTQQLRVAMVGAGDRARWLHRGIVESQRGVVVGYADPAGPDSEFSGSYFARWQELVSATQPDAVVVAVPHDLYQTIVPACLDQGIFVLQEKPLAESYHVSRELYASNERSATHLAVAAQRRHSNAYRALQKVLLEEGPPRHVEYSWFVGLDRVEGDWRLNEKRVGGGAFFDMGYHFVDLMVGLLGVPTESSTVLLFDELPGATGELESSVAGWMRFGGQTVATFSLGWFLRPRSESIRFWWRDFCIEVDELANAVKISPDSKIILASAQERVPLLAGMFSDFCDFVNGERKNVCTGAQALETMQALHDARTNSIRSHYE